MEIDLLYNSSDSINRHGYHIHITAFEKSMKEIFSKGLPMLIGHDFHRSIGRMVSGRMLAANGSEQKVINKACQVNNLIRMAFAAKLLLNL